MNKRALVASGGGSKGCWAVGALRALIEERGGYDVSVGCSVGALTSAFMAQYNPDEQALAIYDLEKIWLELAGDNAVFKNHAPGLLTYVWSLWKGGLRDMSPLRELISKNLDMSRLTSSKTDLLVGVVSLNNGKYKTVGKHNENIVDYIWASCVFPILFSPVKIDNQVWVDGGIRHQIPLMDAIKIEEVTEIDIVLTSPRSGHIHDTISNDKFSNIINVATRGAGILSDEVYVNDMFYIDDRKIKINVWEPSEEVNKDSFKFDKEEIRRNLDRGYVETKKKLEEK